MKQMAAGKPRTALEALMCDRGLTVRGLAEQAGVTPATIHRAKTGTGNLRLDQAAAIAAALSCAIEDLASKPRRRLVAAGRLSGRTDAAA